MALEDDYRPYRETIAAALRILRPDAEVESATLRELEEELERFDPQVVICGGHLRRVRGGRIGQHARLDRAPLDPTRPAKISVGRRYLKQVDPTVEALLEVIDQFE